MDIILHPGPHKTGTTALQAGLLELYGSETPGEVWYPQPPRMGPGHAALAWSCLGLRGLKRSAAPVREAIDRAGAAGCRTLIFSSEEFCRAYPDDLDALAEPFAGHPLHLLFTLSPLPRRAVSSWQEAVKHRSPQTLEQFLEALGKRDDLAPGLRADLVARFCAAFSPARATAIVTNGSDDPAEIFRRFTTATGVAAGQLIAKGLHRNRSLGSIEVEVLRGLNVGVHRSGMKVDHATYMALRNKVIALFGSEDWRSRVPHRVTPLPERWAGTVATLAQETIASLREMQRSGRLAVLGDLDSLAASADEAEIPEAPAAIR